MELRKAYQEVQTRLAKLDFSALFNGFSPFPFALYDDTQAFTEEGYIEKPSFFIGNTSVEYNGRHTAIWYLPDGTADHDVLAAKIVHEMLHAFQKASGEARWADERAALLKYRCDAVNISSRLAEAACMKECLSGNAPEAFSRLMALRRARMERFPDAYDYESRIEQIEGTAQFVELAALRQLDPQKADKQWDRLLGSLADPAQYFPVRSVTYLSGAAFIACLRRYTSFDTDRFTDTPFAVAALEHAHSCALPGADPRVAACMEGWRERMRRIVTQAVEKGDIALQGDHRLIAWNVYDGVRDDEGYAVLSEFLGYLEDGVTVDTDEELFANMKFLNGDFVAKIDEDMHIKCVWRR